MDKLTAPWSEQQVATLNRMQQAGVMHPFTCPHHSSWDLEATEQGWVCSSGSCTYRQNWALAFMADPAVVDQMIEEQTALFAQVDEEIRLYHEELREQDGL